VRRRVVEFIRRLARFTRAFYVSERGGLILALGIGVVAAVPLFTGQGLLNTRGGGDSPFLLQRVHQLSTALAAGHFPVRWMPDANYGYGYPFFHYYAPLSIYVAALFRFLGASYVLAIRFAQLAGFLVAAGATFALARRWFRSPAAGLLASAAYTLAPFHLVNVYVRGDSLAEFWAMAFYPLVLLAADRLLSPERSPRPGAAAILALSYAGLILSHNISALIFSPFLLLFIALRLLRHPAPRRATLWAATALVWGLALSAWFWLPALVETGLAQTGPVTAGYFHFANHFRSADLVQRSLLFSYDVVDGAAFRMGLAQALLTGAALIVLVLGGRRLANAGHRDSRPAPLLAAFLVFALLLATAMITPLSRILWDELPLLAFTQFPWRFLSVQAFFGALVVAALAWLPYRRVWLPLLLLGLLAVALGTLQPDYLALGDEDVTAPRLAEFEWFSGNIGTTVSAEYLPHIVQPRPYSSAWLARGERDSAQVLAGEATALLREREATRQRWDVTAGAEGATLLLPTLYWPGWQATLDGDPLPLAAATGSGLITATVPPGNHVLDVRLGGTPLRTAAEWLSLLTFLLVLPLAWQARTRLRVLLLIALAALLLSAAAFALWPAPRLDSGTLSWDFAQAAYLHHTPEGIAFGDDIRLLRYEYAADEVAPGESWTITLAWEATTPAPVTIALVTPAANRYATAPPLAEAETALRPGTQTVTLAIPATAPAGLYVPRLTIAGREATLASGTPRGDLFLRPVRITGSGESLPPPAALAAHPFSVTVGGAAPALREDPAGPLDCTAATAENAALRISLAWYTNRPLAANLTASLRLHDTLGRLLAQCDLQPGYGFQPSVAWPAGTWTSDLLALPLPDQLPDASPYLLAVHLYDGAGQTVLTQRLGELSWHAGTLQFTATAPNFELPPDLLLAEAQFGDVAVLRGYRLSDPPPESIAVTLYWEALGSQRDNLVRFVQLLDASGQIVARPDGSTVQIDSLPQANSYPTSQWAAGEIVADTVLLSLAGVPPGAYELAVGFYPPADPNARLPVTLLDGQSPPDRVVRLPLTTGD
jgi:hypothetical protein